MKDLIQLDSHKGVPVLDLAPKLKLFDNLKSPTHWGLLFRTAPRQLHSEDDEFITTALQSAQKPACLIKHYVKVVNQIDTLHPNNPSYPERLKQQRSDYELSVINTLGNAKLLQQKTLAIFCSVKCPGDLILKTYDLARDLRDKDISTIGGFHSPMEKECLMLLLRGNQPVIQCPARSLDKMRLSKVQNASIHDNQLLILSPFAGNQHRVTKVLAQKRNQLVIAIAHTVFMAYAAPESKTEKLAHQVIEQETPLLTFDSPDNQNLINIGAKTIEAEIDSLSEFQKNIEF
ncbi:MAG: DNA-processing protein DprA [Cyanobacteria bacterium J06560_6]